MTSDSQLHTPTPWHVSQSGADDYHILGPNPDAGKEHVSYSGDLHYRCQQGHTTTSPLKRTIGYDAEKALVVAVCRECGEEMNFVEDDPITALSREDVEAVIAFIWDAVGNPVYNHEPGTPLQNRRDRLVRVADALAAHMEQREGNKPA